MNTDKTELNMNEMSNVAGSMSESLKYDNLDKEKGPIWLLGRKIYKELFIKRKTLH